MFRDKLISELKFKAVRSGGAGGQHVNKVSSKVILSWDLSNTHSFSEENIELLKSQLSNRLSKYMVLQIECDTTRSQIKNKELAIDRFFVIIEAALVKKRLRKPTKIPKSIILKRLSNKKKLSFKKEGRKRPDID